MTAGAMNQNSTQRLILLGILFFLFQEIDSFWSKWITIHSVIPNDSDPLISHNLPIGIKKDKVRDAPHFEQFLEAFPGLWIWKWNSKPRHLGQVAIEWLIIPIRRDEDHFKVTFRQELFINLHQVWSEMATWTAPWAREIQPHCLSYQITDFNLRKNIKDKYDSSLFSPKISKLKESCTQW